MNKIVFFGTPAISVNALRSLNESDLFEVVAVVTNEDQFIGRSRSSKVPSAVKEYAVANNLKLIQSDSINKDIDQLKGIEFDYLITCAFGQFLSDDVLALPSKKAINIHASLLPEGRGGAPIHWSIIEGKKETGISMMDMISKMDAGNFYQQYKVDISKDETFSSLYVKLQKLIEEKTAIALDEIDRGYAGTVQDESKVSFWPNISKEQRVIDFNKTSEQVYNQIRGLYSIPGATTFYNKELVKVNAAKFYHGGANAEIGKVIKIENNEILISCKEGNIAFTNITLLGKKPTEVSELIKGNIKIQVGGTFENE